MSEEYVINDIVKKIDKPVLKTLLVRLGIPSLASAVDACSPRKFQPLFAACAALPGDQRQKFGEMLEEIAPLAGDGKHIPVCRAYLAELKLETPPEMDAFNIATLVAWCRARLDPAQWRTLCGRANLDALKQTDWYCFDLDFPSPPPHALMTRRAEPLVQAARAFATRHEYRGHHAKYECYSVENRDYIVFKLTDHPASEEFWDDTLQDYAPLEAAKPFRIVLSFNYDTDRLALFYPGPAPYAESLSRDLAEILFADCAYTRMQPLRYDLQRLKNKWELALPPAHTGLKRAVLVGIDLQLGDSNRSRRSCFEADANLAEALREELGDERLENARVKRVQLRLVYDTPRRANSTRSFRITETGIAGLYSAPKCVQNMLCALLEAHHVVIHGPRG